MKTIGHTNEGKVLIECTQDELNAFNILADSAKGKAWSPVYGSFEHAIDTDLLPAFQAIEEWIQVKDRANILRDLAQQIDSAIKANGGVK